MNLSRLPPNWNILTDGERREVRELLDLLETRPPGPVELRAKERIRDILETADARDRARWRFRDPAMPAMTQRKNGASAQSIWTMPTARATQVRTTTRFCVASFDAFKFLIVSSTD